MNARLDEYESVEALAVTMIKNYCIDQIRKQKYIEQADEKSFAYYHDNEPSPQERLERSETYCYNAQDN